MKTSPELQAIIAEIAAKHKLDLSSPDATLELSLPGYNDLRIQRLDEHRVSVSHRYETDSGPAVDPDVIFFTGLDEWVPVAIQDVTGYREVAEVDHGAIAHVRPRGQSEVATLCRVWARNLREQGWLELAAIPGSSGRRPPRS